jgi:hypothetical protein
MALGIAIMSGTALSMIESLRSSGDRLIILSLQSALNKNCGGATRPSVDWIKLQNIVNAALIGKRQGTHRFRRADFRQKSLGTKQVVSPCPHAGSDAYPGVFFIVSVCDTLT